MSLAKERLITAVDTSRLFSLLISILVNTNDFTELFC
jgi:hypothetical protein